MNKPIQSDGSDLPPPSGDPRIDKLPKWAQDIVRSQRRRIDELLRTVEILQGDQPPSMTNLLRPGGKRVGLDFDRPARVEFNLGDGRTIQAYLDAVGDSHEVGLVIFAMDQKALAIDAVASDVMKVRAR